MLPLRHVLGRFIVPLLIFFSFSCHAAEATLAGFAFAGDFKTAPQRFPHSYRIFERHQAEKNSLSAKVLQRSGGVRPAGFELTPAGTLVNLKQGDQALMVVLVLTDEIVSSENHGSYHKTFVNLRGNLLIFDYKAQTVVRTYPLSTVLFDATPNAPSPARIGQFVEDLLVGEGSQSMFSLFARRLASAELPKDGTKTLQVKRAEVAPKALEMMPEPFRQTPAMANAMVADAFASILSAKTGAPLLPNGVGAVDGVMMMRLENGDDFKLKVGEGDYLFDIRINGFVKKKLDQKTLDELEEVLIQADLGVPVAGRLVENLRSMQDVRAAVGDWTRMQRVMEEDAARLDLTGVDTVVLSACVQMPSLPALERVQDRLGLPVISAAACTARVMLQRLGIEPVAPGAGYALAPDFAPFEQGMTL